MMMYVMGIFLSLSAEERYPANMWPRLRMIDWVWSRVPNANVIVTLTNLDLQHHLHNLTFGDKLIIAPIPKEQVLHRVLDVGTGTGIWAIDFADDHPESEVLGCDLSPIQPGL